MATLIPFGGREPEVAATAWLARDVILTGDVTVAEEANLWFGVVARGDVEPIEIGRGSNVQDGVILHTDPGFPCVLGEDVAVGHRAIMHGCRIDDGALIGMGATVLSGAHVGEEAIVGAGALVLEGAEIPPRALAVGVPARVVGSARGDAGRGVCRRYRERAARYREGESRS
jgi:carbonic anhydrase/acetyltransferase-like protein (isoleucine patch superfamily)